jgi:hypothetical protein
LHLLNQLPAPFFHASFYESFVQMTSRGMDDKRFTADSPPQSKTYHGKGYEAHRPEVMMIHLTKADQSVIKAAPAIASFAAMTGAAYQ